MEVLSFNITLQYKVLLFVDFNDMDNKVLSALLNLLMGLLCTFIGFVNCFWGNDPFYGYFITLISLIFYIPLYSLIANKIRPNFITMLKVILVLFILWSSLGVGEMFDKIDMMQHSFPLPKY